MSSTSTPHGEISPRDRGGPPAASNPDRADAAIGSDDHAVWTSRAGRALASVVRSTRGWVGANVALIAMLVAASGLLVAAQWAAEELFESVLDNVGLAALDRPVLTWVEGIRTPSLNAAVAFFSNTGGPVLQPILTALVVLFLGWRWKSWTPVVLALVAAGGSLAMTTLGKQFYGRVRPPLSDAIPPYEYSPSFPSGHTLNGTVIAGILCYLMLHWFRTRGVRTLWVIVAAVYAVAMGLSRVYLGHHWLTDVIAGWVFGLAWLGVVMTLHRLWLTARARFGPQRWTAMLAR